MLKKIFILLILINSFITGQTLKFHLDASDTNNMVYNGNSKITSITTSDANNYVFLQSDTSLAPTLVRNFQNGKPAIYCDGSRYLQKSDFPTTIDFGNDATFFIVFNLTAPTLSVPNQSYLLGTYNGALLGFDAQTGTNAYELRITPGGGYLEKQIYTYKNRITSYAFNINSLNISQYFVNGLPYTGSTVSLSSQFQINEICGWHTPTVERHWYGYIYEIRIYTGTMTRTQIDSVNNVLGEKWDFNALKTIPYYNQHITGSGTSGDPYLIYNHQDMDSITVIGGTSAKWALANNIDCATRDTASPFHVAMGSRPFEGNGYTFKNLIVNRRIWSPIFIGETTDRSLFFQTLNVGANNVKIDSCRFNLHFEISDGGSTYLVGLFTSGFSAIGDSITISNSTLNISLGALADVRIFHSALMTVQNSVFTNSGVLNSNLIIDASQDDFFSNAPYAGIFTGNNSNTQSNKNFVYNCTLHIKGSKAIFGGLYGGRIVNGGHDTSYVRGVIINDNPAARVAGFAAVSTSTNVYDELYSAVEFNFIQNPISYSIFVNDPDGMVLSSSYTDTTLAGFTQDASLSAYGTPVVYKGTTEMKIQNTFINWDFPTPWSIDTNQVINDGYPYLQYFPPVPPGNVTILSPINGEVYTTGDHIIFIWETNDSNVTISSPVNVQIIDSTSYTWRIPDTLDAGSIGFTIYHTENPSVLDQVSITLLSSKFLEIDSTYPSYIAPGTGNNNLYIKTRSNNIPSIKYFYKNSVNNDWTFFGQDSITNIQGADTNTFVWWVTSSSSDSLFIRVEEDRDTSIYSLPDPDLSSKKGWHLGGICYYGLDNFSPFARNFLHDVGCGWVALSKTGFKMISRQWENRSNLNYFQQTVEAGFIQDIRVIKGAFADITMLRLFRINGELSEKPLYTTLSSYNLTGHTPFIWQGYRYYIVSNRLLVDDLINGVNGLVYIDMNPLTLNSTIGITGAAVSWGVAFQHVGYHFFGLLRDSSRVININTPVTEDTVLAYQQREIMGNQNSDINSWLIIYYDGGVAAGTFYTAKMLGNAADKTATLLSDEIALPFTIKRYYFRGIKPRANRHQRYPFNLLGR